MSKQRLIADVEQFAVVLFAYIYNYNIYSNLYVPYFFGYKVYTSKQPTMSLTSFTP